MITMHPGEYLAMCYVEPLKLTQKDLADKLKVSTSAVSRLLAKKADLSPEMAVRLSCVFDRSAESWMLMQMKHSLQIAKEAVDPRDLERVSLESSVEEMHEEDGLALSE